MNMMEAVKVSQAAKKLGLAAAVNNGKIQIQHITPDGKGGSIVVPRSGWVTAGEALQLLEGM